MTNTDSISFGYDPDPARSNSLRVEAYTQEKWFDADLKSVISKTWQWVCHVEKTRTPGSYVTVDIANHPIAVVRDKEGKLPESRRTDNLNQINRS
ncbi:hypothetical protein [Pseudophaeobacter sp.]|uniref:hypothetical protein n=1 Tax=Pseudophaeobacter sp. TaxID=1971739 RepID=UPI003297FDF1